MGAEEDEGIRDPQPCQSYTPGHDVHYIQANRAMRDPETRVPGRVVEIGDAIVVEVDGEVRRFHNHDLDRARDLLAVKGPEVDVQTRWGLLWFDTYVVCVTEKELTPCPTDGLPHGGFLARPNEITPEFVEAFHRSLRGEADPGSGS